jgi:hypothetical protein
MTSTVPPVLRIANAVSGLLFLAGALIYVRAWLGMRALEAYEAEPDAELFAGVARFTHFWELSRLGIGIVLAALGLAVLAAIAAMVVRRRDRIRHGG